MFTPPAAVSQGHVRGGSHVAFLEKSVNRAIGDLVALRQDAAVARPATLPAIRFTIRQLRAAREQTRQALVGGRTGRTASSASVSIQSAVAHQGRGAAANQGNRGQMGGSFGGANENGMDEGTGEEGAGEEGAGEGEGGAGGSGESGSGSAGGSGSGSGGGTGGGGGGGGGGA